MIQGNELEIEIVEVNLIEGGIELFARAWVDGAQIGFGKDGTVDIERFRVFNPPVLVDDPTGDIFREGATNQEDFIQSPGRVLKEDPEAALLEVLRGVIKSVGKKDTQIQSGLVGNTTSTFYSSAGAVSPVDGIVQRNAAGNTWTQTRDGTGTLANNTSDLQFGQGEFCSVCGSRYIITRNVLLFDTSAIPDSDSVSSASITLTSAASGDNTNGDSSNFYSVTTASTSTLATGDYAIANWGSTAYSTAKSLSTINTAGSYTWTLNATGIAAISKTGISYFGERSSNDVNNTTPTQRGYALMRSVDFTGTSSDPYLTVEHAAPPAAKRGAILAFF